MKVISLFLCFYFCNAQIWDDFYNSAEKAYYYWPLTDVPFNDLSGYFNAPGCLNDCIIKIIPCESTCKPGLNCSSLPTTCESQTYVNIVVPYIVKTPNILIESAHPTRKAVFAIESSTRSYYNPVSGFGSCNAFKVQAMNISFKNIEFIIDPECSSLYTTLEKLTPILYTSGGHISLTNIKYNSTEALIFFNTYNSPVHLETFNLVSNGTSTYDIVFLNTSGTLNTCSQDSTDCQAPRIFSNGNLILHGTEKNILNISKLLHMIEIEDFGCPPLITTSNSNCDSKEAAGTILTIVLSTIFGIEGTIFIFMVIQNYRTKKFTSQKP